MTTVSKRSHHHATPSSVPPLGHAIGGSVGSALALLLLYPLERARTELQASVSKELEKQIEYTEIRQTKQAVEPSDKIEYQAIRTKLGAPKTSPTQLHSPVTVQQSLPTDKPLVTQSDQSLKSNMPPRRLLSLDAGPAKRQRIDLKSSPKHSPSPTLHLPLPCIPCDSLRINPNLILTGADYVGGIIIQPSDETPRGLKRLFTQMNAGRRI